MTTATATTACDNAPLSGAIKSPPPAKNRVWKGPRQLPECLAHEAERPIYVLWRYGSTPNGKGKYPKIPFNPHTGKKADTTDPATWGTFAECLERAALWRGWFDGIGRILMPGEVGIDYDDSYDAGALVERVAVDVAEASGYKERSVSQTGLHIIVEGHLAEAIKTDEVELYPGGSGRYFVLTGDELEHSSRPEAAQPLVDRLVATYGPARVKSGRPAAALRQVETVALTAELAADLADARARVPELLQSLRSNMTAQLYALLTRGTFPQAMKDTSASGARAVIVAQLQRAPKRRYTDAEVYLLARALWRRKGYEGAMAGRERLLDADCWRLIALYRPGQRQPERQKRTYKPAPAPLAYLATLAEAATAGEVRLNRDERASLAGVPRATAQRVEERLVTERLVELDTYALEAPARGRRGLIRITDGGLRALGLHNESVNLEAPAADALVKDSAPERAKPTIDAPKNTLVGEGGEPAPAGPPPPRVLPTPEEPPALVDEPATLERLVADAVDAYGTSYQFGQAKPLERVLAYVAANGGARFTRQQVERAYRAELDKREREREAQRVAEMSLAELAKERKSAEKHIAEGMALEPQRRPGESDERHAERGRRWQRARRSLPYWRWYHAHLCVVIAAKRSAIVDAPLLEMLERHEAERPAGYTVRKVGRMYQLVRASGAITPHASEESAWSAAREEARLLQDPRAEGRTFVVLEPGLALVA